MTENTAEPAELDVSVVLFNSARWFGPFLESLVAQDYPSRRIALLVRDNGSSEEEFERCRYALSRRSGAFRAVRIERGANVGFGAGHNDNFRRATADLFLVTNVDLEFVPDSIVVAARALQADPERVACREFRQQPYEHPKHYHPATLDVTWCSSACVLFRKRAFASVGGYDARIFLYGEDVDLSYRLRDQGFLLKYCPQAVCIHHTYASAGEIKPEQFFGSTLANFYLRLRFGSFLHVVGGAVLQLSLWLYAPALPDRYRRLARNAARMIVNAPYFLRTRRRSAAAFPFHRWDYELRREGAFYTLPEWTGTPPLVSVIIRTHAGRLGWLNEALQSLVHQTYRNLEVIVIEDGSEGAREAVARLAATGRFTAVRYRSIPKGGRCRAGNAGLETATGEFLCFLDDDDLFYADHVEVLARELAAYPENAAVFGLAWETPTIVESTEPLRYRERDMGLVHRRPFSRALLWVRNFLPIQSVLFRRGCYERHGGFDLELENLEDWNLWTRYSAESDFRRVPKTTSLYRVPGDVAELLRRSSVLTDYYEQAREKQRALKATLSPAEVLAFEEEVAQLENELVMDAEPVRRLITVLPILKPLVLPARRLVRWWRRVSSAR